MNTINNSKTNRFRKTSIATAVMASSMMISLSAQAFDFKIGSGEDKVEFEWNNHLTYAAMHRTESASEANTVPVQHGSPIRYVPDGQGGWTDLLGRGYNPNYNFNDAAQAARVQNGNDGNLNFDGLVQNRISVLSELSMNYKNFGAFVRARAWYDDVWQNQDPASWDPNLDYTSNNPGAHGAGEFPSEAQDYMGSHAEILDAYIYTSFWLGNKPGSLKVGRQVINWGESMAFSNSINSAINPVDANAGTRAGVDLKEIFMPTESLYFQMGLTQKINMQAFYQWKHRGTELVASGSFFSEVDMLGAGGSMMFAGDLVPNNDMTGDVKDGGQYGLAFTYFTDSGTEYGIYAVNAHDKAPSLQVNSDASAYDTWYAEDRQVYAASFSTLMGSTNVSGELSYRPNAPIVLDANCVNLNNSIGNLPGDPYPDQDELDRLSCTTHDPSEVVDASYTQAQVSFAHVLQHNSLWDSANLAGEIVGWYYDDINKDGVDVTKEDMFFTNTPYGVGTLFRIGLDYNNVLGGANLTIPLTWQYGWAGTNSRTNSREGASILSIGATLVFPNNIETSLTYTQYDGESDDQSDPTFYHLNDRDNIAISAKYSF